MKHAPAIAGGLLALAFIVFGLNHFVSFIPMPKDGPPPTPEAIAFMTGLAPSGYLGFVKVMEILGGLLVAIPLTRNLGLLVLGPILINILCYHVFLMKGATVADPVLILLCVLALFLLWSGRRAFAALIPPRA